MKIEVNTIWAKYRETLSPSAPSSPHLLLIQIWLRPPRLQGLAEQGATWSILFVHGIFDHIQFLPNTHVKSAFTTSPLLEKGTWWIWYSYSTIWEHLFPQFYESLSLSTYRKLLKLALAGGAQWTECQPANWKVAGLNASQGMCLGRGQVPSWRHVKGNSRCLSCTIDVSLPLSFPYLLRISKIKKKKKGNY